MKSIIIVSSRDMGIIPSQPTIKGMLRILVYNIIYGNVVWIRDVKLSWIKINISPFVILTVHEELSELYDNHFPISLERNREAEN